jgi:hypothetical protein
VTFEEKFQYRRGNEVVVLPFAKRVNFDEMRLAILSNYGDLNRTCIGKFDLYRLPE